jgi:hypothetical protein
MSANPQDIRKAVSCSTTAIAPTDNDYVVADLSQAAFGRKEILHCRDRDAGPGADPGRVCR